MEHLKTTTRPKSDLSTFIVDLEKIPKNSSKVAIQFSIMGVGQEPQRANFPVRLKKVHAIDISSKMIEIAREKAAVAKVENVIFEQTDIFDNEFAKESYDVILAFNMLHTVPSPQDVVLRINELLKPEGLFISVTPCLRQKMSFLVNLQIQLVRVLCKLGLIPIPIRRVTSSEVESLLEAGGFQAVESEEIYKDASSYFVVAKKLQKT